MLDRAGNFTGTQAPGTNIHMARRTIDQSLHALDVGLPGTIGTTMRVGNLDTKGNALAAAFTLSHGTCTSCSEVRNQNNQLDYFTRDAEKKQEQI